MVTSSGCCWHSGGNTQSPDCWSSCNALGKMGAGEMEDDRGIVVGDECEVDKQNLGGRRVLILMRKNIFVGEVVVVVV